MNEEWKTVEYLPSEYEISNLGNLRRFNKDVAKIVNPRKDRCGYFRVSIAGRTYAIHRLVASAFIPNPYNFPIVHHIDECKTNNAVNNLIWCTYRQNNLFGTPGRSMQNAKRGYIILQQDLEGKTIAEWNTFEEARRSLGIKDASTIARCAWHKKNWKTAYGYKWDIRYKNDTEVPLEFIKLLKEAYILAPDETRCRLKEIIGNYSQ